MHPKGDRRLQGCPEPGSSPSGGRRRRSTVQKPELEGQDLRRDSGLTFVCEGDGCSPRVNNIRERGLRRILKPEAYQGRNTSRTKVARTFVGNRRACEM